ncbi:MAG: rhodanese-like domain-containing protein [Bdellovibrionota bacterium]
MFFRQIYDTSLAQAAYLIGCQRTGEAVVIDPERDIERYVELATREGLKIVGVAETHIHADFLSGAREFAEHHDVMLFLSDEGDSDWKYGWLHSREGAGGSYRHTLLHDGDFFHIGNIRFDVRHTPGHTPEHISFLVTDEGGGATEPMGILSGDFVFVGDVGRPDLLEVAAGIAEQKEPSARRLFESSVNFLDLPDYVQVWPAHGAGSACGKALGAVPQSTVGYERRFNPALQLTSERDRFLGYVLEGQPEPPLYFARMKLQNRDGVPLLSGEPLPDKPMASSSLSAEKLASVTVLDTRPWEEFKVAHLRGSLFAPLGSAFVSLAGSYVTPEEEILLVVSNFTHFQEAVVALRRIGLDKVGGFILASDMKGCSSELLAKTQEVQPDAFLAARAENGLFVLDVRSEAEFREGALEGAVNVPHLLLPKFIGELPSEQDIFVHCRSGVRSSYSCALLEKKGLHPVNIIGGYEALK